MDESTPPLGLRPLSKRHALPASPGLPPSRYTPDRATRLQRLHPGKPGRPTLQRSEEIIAETLSRIDEQPADIAIDLGASVLARPVKQVITAAREALARHAEVFVQDLMTASSEAAAKGDAKPAIWALERISDGETRIVDPPAQQSSAPSIQIGFALGGIPQSVNLLPEIREIDALTAQDLPPLTAGVDDGTTEG